jgi:hypothetical protein
MKESINITVDANQKKKLTEEARKRILEGVFEVIGE